MERTESRQGEAHAGNRRVETQSAMMGNVNSGKALQMESVVERGNLLEALKRVKQNKGSPGVDGMKVEDMDANLRENWVGIREQLLAGTYQPSPVKRVMIPKNGGGERELGIPTVIDRFIQQALLQILQPIIDPTFSPHSYGFRPGRSAHQAVRSAKSYVGQGLRWVVDVDLEKFFDRVNHDVLMGRMEKRVQDKRILGLIRNYLEAGIMLHGVVTERNEGTPQGGPLSPLLANVLLDDVDKELEKHGHKFARYADDCNVYVASERAGKRVMGHLRKLYGKLKLRINESKSAVARVTERKFLGFSMWYGAKGAVKLRVAHQAMDKMKEKVRQITERNGGRSVQTVVEELGRYLPGWRNYFGLAETPGIFNELDEWIRHRLRQLHLKQWKRSKTIYRELLARRVPGWIARKIAANSRRWWHNSCMSLNHALPIKYFDDLGLPRLSKVK
jgi:group II intron reverse transcriptase/maturase